MTSLTIHYLEKTVCEFSNNKNRIAIYDKDGGHGISIPIERFLKIAEAVKKELEKESLK